jgi:hypothetical protein
VAADNLTEAGLSDLVAKNVVTKDTVLTMEAYALLGILAGATKYASIHFSGDSGQVNRITYWKGDAAASLDNTGGAFTVSVGADTSALEVILKELTGSNHVVSSTFSATLDFRSALAFAAIFDLSRQATMRLYADGIPIPSGFSAASIAGFASEERNARWLTAHLKSLRIPGLAISTTDAEKSLESMAAAGIVETTGGVYSLIYDSAQLAARFLFIENTVHFRCGSEDTGEMKVAECVYLQAGLHDTIMVDVAADKLEISAVPSFDMVNDIKRMMMTPPAF